MRPYLELPLAVFLAIWTMNSPTIADDPTGASVVNYHGYDDCIRLWNDHTSVILCPAAGGRVLEYSLDGINMLYLTDEGAGWKLGKSDGRGIMNAGRFDIGPEMVVHRAKVLWMGEWQSEITGDRSARLTSQYDEASGARLIRNFRLDAKGTHLTCEQIIINESGAPVSLCHWSRTFAIGGGIAVVPRSQHGRFPKGYTMYGPGRVLQSNPDDPNIRVSDDAVFVTGPPAFPKLGFDSHSGWMAYLAPTNQMFVKRFKTYPERAYNEFAALTISVWYPEKDRVELEPIGPAENLNPGQRASFTENWYLLQREFPKDRHDIDFEEIKKQVDESTGIDS